MDLSVQDRELFLAEPHIAAFSVAAGPDRGPWSVPIWYQYTPGGQAWVLTTAGSRKARLIEAAGRFTLTVDRLVDAYIKLAESEFGEQVAIYLRPQRWLTGDMGPS